MEKNEEYLRSWKWTKRNNDPDLEVFLRKSKPDIQDEQIATENQKGTEKVQNL